ncbi:hypothetical protein N3K66_007546 [Trichothecium roseum]|uniref:Uncharacterized protein n=1 Tax=Trichothecium roseum TaxID=47278 RepID=A0ACC0UVD7_9HYPO|nr:hypothetical protein N3K66_007546 [Trichothecium roseum]
MEEFTAGQIAEHNSPEDAWMTIHGQVYNVSKYLQDHPGGPDVLAEAAGADASQAFDDAGHSEDALDIMRGYAVGRLKGYEKKKAKLRPVAAPGGTAAGADSSSANKGRRAASRAANLVLLLLAVGGVYYVGRKRGGVSGLSVPKWLTARVVPHAAASPEHGGLGFIKGLLVGGGIFAAADALLAHHLAGLITSSGSKSFTTYPPHMKVAKRAEDDALLRRGLLDPVKYTPLPLEKKTQVSPNVYRLTFRLPSTSTVLGLPVGQHVVVKADDPTGNGETVTRSYTPVTNNADLGILELVVKMYPDGKLTGGYLSGLVPGDEVLFRGPKGAMRYRPGLCRNMGMVAGGTGITPMLQLIRAVCEHHRDTARITLLYANRAEEDILLRDELDAFARRYPLNFEVHYVLDRPPPGWQGSSGYVTKELMREKLPGPSGDTKIMLCGPPGLVSGAKESLVELGFERPGASAKMSDQIFVF